MKKIWIGIVAAAMGGAAAVLAPAQATQEGMESEAFRARINPGRVSPGASLADWKGLRCRVHLRVDFNPWAGVSSIRSGTSATGLTSVGDAPLYADGILRDVSNDAVVVTGHHGHVWIPRDQIRAIEAIQNDSTEVRPNTP